jgi:hypothetical protein
MTTCSPLILRRAIRRSPGGGRLRFLRVAAFLLWAIAAALALPGITFADDDLPGRVGRVADVGGELFLAPQDKPDQWVAIGLNYPVTSGDNLWVGNDGRAEIDFGAGQFRLAGDTSLHLSQLDDRQFALFVAQGRVNVRVRALEPGETARIDTPNTQVVLTRPGLYRVDVSEDREHTQLVVREGEANVLTSGGVHQVLPGQTAAVDGADPRFADVRNGVGSDGFDTWAASRDRRYYGRTANYVSPQMVGAADLDQYGTWSQVPEYGAVWYPSDVGADWAPYRNGYWTEVGAWGPTWVDYAPWGYAPFHYGRWAYISGRWGWCPGAYVARPLWAPALVGWAGGSGWSLSATVGAPVYGWVPLGWGEPYRPWWGRCSNGCWNRYNRPYAVNVAVVRPNSPPTRYVNWNAPGGITAVSGSALVMRQPVQANRVRVPGGVAASAPVLASAPIVRSEPGRIPMRRVGEGAPPPASTFYPTNARAGGAPGAIGAVPGGASAVAVPTVRTRPTAPTTAPPYARPTQPSATQGAAPAYGPGGAATIVQPAVRQAPLPVNPQGVASTTGSFPATRGEQRIEPRTDQRMTGRTMPQTPAAVPAQPSQGYAAPQGMARQQQTPAGAPTALPQPYAAPPANTVARPPQMHPQPASAQAQAPGMAVPVAPTVRSSPGAPAAAPVQVAPPAAAAPPPQEGGNAIRRGDRGAP